MTQVCISLLNDTFIKYRINWQFLPRKYKEQRYEGSCAVASLARAVQLSITNYNSECNYEAFIELIEHELEDWSVMLASCMIRSTICNNK